MPDNIVPFQLPKRPKVREKDAPPDQRKVCVLPFRAVADKQLTDGGLRVLAAICSYCNRAGLTWVSQAKVAQDLRVSQQAISKHMKLLVSLGYVEIVRKGFRGERSNTIRVIFDPSVSAEDAIAITSAQENTRPPAMQDETPDPEGQRRIAQLIRQALKTPPQPKERTMPKSGETRTVKAIKEANQKAKARASKASSFTTSEVVHGEAVDNPSIHNQYTTSEVVPNTENTGIDKSKSNTFNKPNVVLNNLSEEQRVEIAAAGVSEAEASQALQILLDTYRSEGLTPNQATLAAEVISLADAGRIQ